MAGGELSDDGDTGSAEAGSLQAPATTRAEGDSGDLREVTVEASGGDSVDGAGDDGVGEEGAAVAVSTLNGLAGCWAAVDI